ncbi:hypothetical protein [Eubacterium barkeri]|nr:hypothetical protein [Eubacterium barkeri]
MKKYLITVAAALVVAMAVLWMRSTPAIGGEWLMVLMAPGGVWVWEDLR